MDEARIGAGAAQLVLTAPRPVSGQVGPVELMTVAVRDGALSASRDVWEGHAVGFGSLVDFFAGADTAAPRPRRGTQPHGGRPPGRDPGLITTPRRSATGPTNPVPATDAVARPGPPRSAGRGRGGRSRSGGFVVTGVIEQVPAWPVVAPSALVAAVAGTAVLVRRGRLTPGRVFTVLVSVAYAAAVVTLTFFPLQIATGDYGNRVSWLEKANLVPVLTIDVRTFVLNVLLFVPFGVLLPLWRRSVTGAGAARWGLAASAVIEIVQWVTDVLVSSGRAADVNDLIANTVGAVLGFGALRWVTRTGPGRALVGSCAVTPVGTDEHGPAVDTSVVP